MNARTCQLCGKPLSRIWVGAGEDFCSREHRNQYRLRRGMDRLLEANKVASLMRRRENPKPLSATVAPSGCDPRNPESGPMRFATRAATTTLRMRYASPGVEPLRARGPVERSAILSTEPKRREFEILRNFQLRLILGDRVRRIETPGANYLNKARQPYALRFRGKYGQGLRVSASAGFRLPAVNRSGVRVPGLRRPAMCWPSDPQLDVFATDNERTVASYMSIDLPTPDLRTPTSPTAIRGVGGRTQLKPPGPAEYEPWEALDIDAPAQRECGFVQSRWEVELPEPVAHATEQRMAASFLSLQKKTEMAHAAPHIALVPFAPQEATFGYIPPIMTAVAPEPIAIEPNLEDDFDSGLKNWSGGVQDWSVDAAGVRTGSMALFTPSRELRDYELEFLARIENKSVMWAFRAANMTDYYSVSIAAMAGGGFEFTRATVTGGKRGSVVTVPLKIALKTRTAFTVRLRVRGTEFTVWIDGESIETWTDSRLTVGGIGVGGVPTDRARIYWVRLSPSGGLGKEYPRR